MVWALGALVLLTVAPGCSAARVTKLEGRVGELNDEVAELRRGQAAQRVQFDEFRNRLVMMQDTLESQRVHSARARASRHNSNDEPPSLPHIVVPSSGGLAMRPPGGEPEPSSQGAPRRSVVIGPDGVVEIHDDPTKPGKSHVRPPSSPSKTARTAPAGPSTNGARPPQNQSAEQAAAGSYRAAKERLDSGQLPAARDAFTAFLRDHPDHQLADNALYWMGETYYAQSLWLRAARIFGQVVERYPAGNKVPDAMLKTALCYKNLGETRLARDTFSQLMNLYSGTHAADIARKQLALLGDQR